MNPLPQSTPDRRTLWLGAPGADDSKRSLDEVRIIKEMTKEEVEVFLQVNNIDDAAARELRSEPPHVALAVLERGPLRACVNPSGALVARIRDAKRGILGGAARYGTVAVVPLGPDATEADRFLVENRIDQAGAASFRSETAEVQKAVMAKGPLVNTTNPSASLMARIRTVKVNIQAGIGLGLGAPAPLGGMQPQAMGTPALALEDHRFAGVGAGAPGDPGAFNMGDEAARAISKMVSGQAGPPSLSMALRGANGSSSITNIEDKRLQDEALKAIQALNAGGP